MKETFPTADSVVRHIADRLTDDYWSSKYNPAPRTFPEENEAI